MHMRLALAFVLVACGSSPSSDAEGGTTDASTDDEDDGAPSSGTPTPSPSTSSGSTSSEPEGSTGMPDPTTGGEETTGSTETGTGGLDAHGCPADAPDAWISCENFDAIDDPQTQIAQWNVNADAFGIEPDDDDPGDRLLRVTLTPGVQFGGWVTLRFGEGPDAPGVDSPDDTFDEVWIRVRLRTGDDWPGRQIGDTVEVIAMNGEHWGIAADLNIQGDGALRVHPVGWTCIFDGVQACNGMNDWAGTLQQIWNGVGPSTVFDADSAGEWKCMEAHMKLNTPGTDDGEAGVWIDGNEEYVRTGIDWRGTWSEYGLNAIRFTNYAPPPAEPLSYYFDDLVVATERVGC